MSEPQPKANEARPFLAGFRPFAWRFLIPLGVSFGVLAVLGTRVLARNIILPNQIAGPYKVDRMERPEESDEIPALGSSRMLGGIVPSVLAPQVFNYGLNGLGTEGLLFFLEAEMSHARATPVILNIDPWGLSEGYGDVGNYLLNLNSSRVQRLLKRDLPWKARIPVLALYGHFLKYVGSYINFRLGATKVIDRGGAFEKNRFTPARFQQYVRQREAERFALHAPPRMARRLRACIAATRRMIVVVLAPCHRSLHEKFESDRAYESFLNELRQFPNVVIVDRTRMFDDDRYFMDTAHVTDEGARLYTASVRDELVARGVLTAQKHSERLP